MPRLHTLYLPGPDSRFAFILDQTNPMTEEAMAAWDEFAENCGAQGIMLTEDTIDIDPEISDGWQPDDEPVDYAPAEQCCGPRVVGLPDLLSMVQAAHAAAWVPWAPPNLDPESPKISTHPAESCAAVNNEATGCPMHAPILGGTWAGWPFFAANPADIGPTIVRICDHGISHPTPEEYAGGFDTPHLCDGCDCAPPVERAQFSIVVSDLANARLPRGTLLLGVKDDPTPVTAPPAPSYHSAPADGLVPVRVPDLKPCDAYVYLPSGSTPPCALGFGHRRFHLALIDGNLVGAYSDPIPAPDGEGPIAFVVALDNNHPLVQAMDAALKPRPDLTAENWGTATIQPLGADGEPVGEAKDYPLAGPVRVTEIPTEQGEPIEKWSKAEIAFTEILPCGAGSLGAPCQRPRGHDGLHEFGPFNRV